MHLLLQVREVSASQVTLLAGAAELQRVVGRSVDISVQQAQGTATIGVMYADRAAVQTGGRAARGAPARLPCTVPCVLGSCARWCAVRGADAALGAALAGGAALLVGQLNCTESAELSTSGGSISISNVDNNCSVSTSGGSIQVQGMRSGCIVGECTTSQEPASRLDCAVTCRPCAGTPQRQGAQRQPQQRRRRRGCDSQPQHCGQAAGGQRRRCTLDWSRCVRDFDVGCIGALPHASQHGHISSALMLPIHHS